MKLNEYFRDVTKEKGLTTYQLAELIGINQSYISTIFSGKKGIGEGMFVRLCDALELDEDEVREIYADGIAERGHPKVGSVHEHHARPVRRNGIKKVKLHGKGGDG